MHPRRFLHCSHTRSRHRVVAALLTFLRWKGLRHPPQLRRQVQLQRVLWKPSEFPNSHMKTSAHPKGAWKVDQECYLPRVNKVVRFCSQSSPTVGIHSTKGQHMQSHLREEVRSTQRECLCEISKGLWLCSRRAAWHDLTESPGNPVAQRACHHQPMSFLVWLKANFH